MHTPQKSQIPRSIAYNNLIAETVCLEITFNRVTGSMSRFLQCVVVQFLQEGFPKVALAVMST